MSGSEDSESLYALEWNNNISGSSALLQMNDVLNFTVFQSQLLLWCPMSTVSGFHEPCSATERDII
jgi:hypothetical protein